MINSYQIGRLELNKIKRDGRRPTILLHACCGPCSTYPLELLNDYFDITIFFNNSNIYPYEEYNRRLNELVRYLEIFNKEHQTNIPIIIQPYDEKFMDYLGIRKNDRERGPRCRLCYVTRMKEAYQYASDHDFEYFTTVMTISRQKDEQVLNKIGLVLQDLYPKTKFFVFNFKKKGGIEIGIAIAEKYNLYQQIYCGCKYGIENKKKRD